MLSETTRRFLSAQTYRSDAQLRICWLPLLGIYWEDELPEIQYLQRISEDDSNQILRVFGIRKLLWKNESLSVAERRFWDDMQLQVPSWAVFYRQQISAEALRLQEHIEQDAVDIIEGLSADADEVSVSEKDDIETVSLRFRVPDEKIPE